MIRALRSIVHDDASVDQAQQMYKDLAATRSSGVASEVSDVRVRTITGRARIEATGNQAFAHREADTGWHRPAFEMSPGVVPFASFPGRRTATSVPVPAQGPRWPLASTVSDAKGLGAFRVDRLLPRRDTSGSALRERLRVRGKDGVQCPLGSLVDRAARRVDVVHGDRPAHAFVEGDATAETRARTS